MKKTKNIEIGALKIFAAVSNSETLTQAGEQLGITQSAVSQAIKQLEIQTDTQLVITRSRPIKLTPSGQVLKEYARQRGVLGVYPLLHFSDMANKKRVIIPFMYNNELVGWTGRHINPPTKETPKFLNNIKAGYVFNVDAFAGTEREIVIVTEGIFDAILVDGVAVQGNAVSPEQAQLIDKLGKRVILCPDRDSAGKDLIEQAITLDWEISFPPWDKDVKDAADAVSKYGRLLTVASIIKHATKNKMKSQVKMRML